jgi:hypothetical protein
MFYETGPRMEMLRDRKAAAASGTPFKAQNNFQLRVRKNSGPQQPQQQQQHPEVRTYQVTAS